MSKLSLLIKQFIQKADFTQKTLATFKRKWSQLSGQRLPRHADILKFYQKLVKEKEINVNKDFENLLRLKKIRTLSGVSPVAVLTFPFVCPGECVYCPTQKDIPKSYLGDEPAVLRAKALNFDPYKQVSYRLKQYEAIGHQPQKVELIVLGGTWSVLPKIYKIQFITDCFKACNQRKQNSIISSFNKQEKNQEENSIFEILKREQRRNEKAKYRLVGLTLETRPDYINPKEIKLMRQLGCTRVELGVQSIYNDVLQKVKRGHTVETTIEATKMLKDAGFKICYHLMPNLPGSNFKRDLQMFKIIFSDERFKPDMVKIYPCMVTYQSELYHWYKQGKFKPYSDKELIKLLTEIKKIVPRWVRINRLGRDIPVQNIAAGCKFSNLRQLLKVKCVCIRCREIKNKVNQLKPNDKSLKLKISHYPASGGQEYFFEYIDDLDRLYALLRLRIQKSQAMVRELHTFGRALALDLNESQKAVQHQGLGKSLLEKAEEVVKKEKIKQIKVIAGVGVRDYYRRLGYKLRNTYMIKKLL